MTIEFLLHLNCKGVGGESEQERESNTHRRGEREIKREQSVYLKIGKTYQSIANMGFIWILIHNENYKNKTFMRQLKM